MPPYLFPHCERFIQHVIMVTTDNGKCSVVIILIGCPAKVRTKQLSTSRGATGGTGARGNSGSSLVTGHRRMRNS